MRFLTFFFFFFVSSLLCGVCAQDCYRLVFWNVENLFDTSNDSISNDDDFTPEGQYRWTEKRYKTKLQHLSQAVIAMGYYGLNRTRLELPLAIGMAEIENDKVLRDLCRSTQLRKYRYDYVHFDSPDPRGIDNALLYRRDLFRPFLSQSIGVADSGHFRTRDILLVEGTTPQDDTIVIIVNHFPSKRNAENNRKREVVARKLRHIMDTVSAAHREAAVIVMGDFNATPQDAEIRQTLMHGFENGYVNLMSRSKKRGSYKYQGQWSFLDQIIVSRNIVDNDGLSSFRVATEEGQVFDGDFLLVPDERWLGKKVNRTYLGIRYQGGYSDHLPVYVDIQRRK